MVFLLLLFSLIPSFHSELVQISWEATPGADTGVLTHLVTASYKDQRKYLDAILEALETTSTGDIISKKVGLQIKNVVLGFSAWESRIGAGAQSFADVETLQNGLKLDVNTNHKSILNQYCAILGYLLRQDAVIWYYQDKQSIGLDEQNGVEAKFNAQLNVSDFQEIYNQLNSQFNTWDLAPGDVSNSTGFNVLNYEPKISNETFQMGMKSVLSNLNKIGLGKGLKNQDQFRSIGEYLSNDWNKYPEGDGYFEYVQDNELWKWAKEMREWRIDVVNREYERNTVRSFLSK